MGERLAAYVSQRHTARATARETLAWYRASLKEYSVCKGIKRGQTVLCGYYGFGNVGDDALLRASISRLSEGEDVIALTKNGRRDEPRFGIACVRRTSPWAIRTAMRDASRLVLGGGTLLQDGTSLRSLLYYTALLVYAKRRGLRIELWGNGLSLPRTAPGERMLRCGLAHCDRIGLRDKPSLLLASRLLRKVDTVLIAEEDLARRTPPCSRERLAYLKQRLGLCDLPCGYAIVAPKGGEQRGMCGLMRQWLALLRAEGTMLLFVPMLPREDEVLCRRWAREMEGICVPPGSLCASDLVGLAAESRIVCGMRLHALVFAASAMTPFVGFGADTKVETFCRENGGVYFTDLYGKEKKKSNEMHP